MKTSKQHPKKLESDLVTDQPGFSVFIIGVSIALVAGLLFRGFFSSDKIKEHISAAALRIHKNVKVEFSSARLSLSSNGFPRIAVIVNDIVMSSSETCWMAPQINIDEIVLPISLKNILSDQSAISEVLVGKVELRLNGEWKFCQPKENPDQRANSPETNQKFVSLVPSEAKMNENVSNLVREVRIEEIKLLHKDLKSIPSFLTNMIITLKSEQPKIILLQAESYFLNESQQRDYTSKAEIHVEYNEFPERKLQTHLLGQFREGHFTIQLQNRLDEGQYNLELDLRHLPLSKIFSTLRGFGFNSDLNPKQAWLSLKGKSRGFVDKIQSENFEVKDLKLEGDVGELSTDLIEFSQLSPLKIKPFLMKAEQLDLGKVLSFYSKTQIIPILGDLGKFSGRVEIFDSEEFRFFGFHRGLEFVFSSLGTRELQRINQMSLDASLKKKKWNLKLNRFEMEKGSYVGEVLLNADREFRKVDVKVGVDEIALSPSVQTLVTQGGNLSPFKGNLNFSWENGVLQKIIGVMSAEEATISRIKLEDLLFQFETSKDFPFVLKTKFQNAVLSEEYFKNGFLAQVVKPNWLVDGGIHLNRISGQMRFAHDRSADWKGFQASLTGGAERMSSDGSWDAKGVLEGSLNVKSPQGNLKWKVTGTRDEPIIKESADSANARVESTSH